jgi:uncharacterized protein YfdQ (DUF2303 family)
MNTDLNKETADLIGALTLAAAEPKMLAGRIPALTLPTGDGGAALTLLEAALAGPVAKRGTVTLHDPASFVHYALSHRTESRTRIFADLDKLLVTAVLDWHVTGDAAQQAGWGDHRALLPAKLTRNWQRWITANKQGMTQLQFAAFIEDNLEDIAEPAGAVILELARKFDLRRDTQFTQAVNIESGAVQFTYHEQDERKGTVDVPRAFTLGLQPFEGADSYKVEARIRWRLADQKLSIWFDLRNPERIIEDAFRARVAALADKGLVALYGVAPDAIKPMGAR